MRIETVRNLFSNYISLLICISLIIYVNPSNKISLINLFLYFSLLQIIFFYVFKYLEDAPENLNEMCKR